MGRYRGTFNPVCQYHSFSVFILASNDTGQIFYDMKAVEDLLDRSNEGIEQKESSMNEYLSSFKVRKFVALFCF